MKKIYLLCLMLFAALASTAQDFEIVSVESLPNDFAAREEIKTDHNDRQCALLRLATQSITPEQRELFTFKTDLGSEVVERATRNGEIWLWVSPGLKYLRIMHRDWGQYELHLLDYVSRVEALHTYKITIRCTEPGDHRITQQYLMFQIMPANALLEVDGQLWSVDADGTAMKYVDFGTYSYRVMASDYFTETGKVTVDDPENTKIVPVTLKPNFAEITLAVDADAEIWVNNQKKGTRRWTGSLGNGTYKIECKQANHETSMVSKKITPTMNGETITLPAPTPIYGSLNIESTPNLATIYIDGKEVGKTPKSIPQIIIGEHELRLVKDGYNNYDETVTIFKGERKQVKIILEEKDTKTKEKELAWKNSFFPVFTDKGEPFYYEIGLWDDDEGPDTKTEYRYKDINGKTYPDGVLFAHNQRLAVEENGKLIIYSADGRKFGPFDGLTVTDYIVHAYDYDNIKILKDGKCGLIDKDGKLLIPPIYERLQEMLSHELYMAEKNGKMGVITIHNDIVEPFAFKPETVFSNRIITVKKDEKMGCIDAMTGKLIIPCRYKYINTNGDIIVAKNEENIYGVFNCKGILIHPFEYTYISNNERSSRVYKLNKEKNGVSLLINGKGDIIENDCCALGVVLESVYDLFVYCRWTNKEKNEKEWCLADVNTGEVKSVIDSKIVRECRLDIGTSHYWSGRYYKCERKNEKTNEKEQGVWDLFTQKMVIPYSAGKIYIEYGNSHEIVSCSRDSDKFNNELHDITFYSFPDGKVTNTYKDVRISGITYFENGMERGNCIIVLDNNKGILVDDYGNPIISCECWNNGDDNPCYNLCRTKDYIVDASKGVYDTKGNLLIEGKYGDILEDEDLKCIVLYRLGDSRKTGKNRECYVYENGKLKQVEDKGSLSELVFSVIQQRCK